MLMIVSRFRTNSLILVIFNSFSIPLLTITLWIITLYQTFPYNDIKTLTIFSFPLMLTYTSFLMIYHVRFKWNKITLTEDKIYIKELLGYGGSKIFDFKEIEKASRSHENVRIGSGEVLYLYKDGSRITEISDFSYVNFREIKNLLLNKVRSKDIEDYSYWKNFKQVIG